MRFQYLDMVCNPDPSVQIKMKDSEVLLSFGPRPRIVKRAIYTLYGVALLDLLAVSLFLPLINREIKNYGGSPFLMGLVTSIYGGIQLFSSPLLGHASDIYGRKIVIISTIIMAAGGYVLLGTASSLLVLLVARVVAGFFKHTQTLCKVIITDLAPSEKSYVLGNFNAFGSMGFILGPTIGGHLAEGQNGFHHVCYLASIIFILNAFLVIFLVPETLSLKDYNKNLNDLKFQKHSKLDPNDKSQITSLTIMILLVLRFLFALSTLVPRANLFLILEAKYAINVVSFGYMNSLQSIVSTITGFMVSFVSRGFYKENNKLMVLHGSFIQFVALLGYSFSSSFRMAGLSLMMLSAANPFLRVGTTALSLSYSDDHGAILGLGQTSSSLARMLSPVISGIVQQYGTDDYPAFFSTLTSLVGFVLTALLLKRTNPSSSFKAKMVS